MHELSIALSILEIAEEESHRRGDAAIHAIHIRIGPLSGVVREALLSAFDLAREDSAFETCRLEVESMPLVIECSQCGEKVEVGSPQDMRCPTCGTPSSRVVGGSEMEIIAMEIAA